MEGDRMEVGDLKQNPNDTNNIHVEVHVKSTSTAKRSDVKMHVLNLLNRHRMVFGAFRWTEFDEDFLIKHVQSVAIVDAERKVKYYMTA
nr:pachytene checkpoint protein 2 homolog [Oncorhynchus nerka]